MQSSKLVKRFRIDKPKKFRLRDYDPADTSGLSFDKAEIRALIDADIKRLEQYQERLYAEDHWAVLVILQGLDSAGKDGVIKHVMSGVNPQGCEVRAFKQPSAEELHHDFLWRAASHLPERGRIGIFNRSYYEEVLVVRVHPELLAQEKLPRGLVTKGIWTQRFEDICAFERHLARNGILILKFFLNLSKEEQRKRLLARLDEPTKHWKFSKSDFAERKLWTKYRAAYEDMIRHTSHAQAPWHVIPADNKWFTRLLVAAAMSDALQRLKPKYPTVGGKALVEMKRVRRALLAEGRK
jgi:PPK2 family polyphosphate:nucleotide phosphotransferase